MVIWLLPFPDGWFLCDRFYPLLLSMVISVSGLHDNLYPLALQDGKPLCMDVLLGVLIPVMPGPALRTGPFPDLQVLDLRVLIPAAPACLGGREPPAHLAEVFPCLLHLILYNGQEL